MKLHNQKSYLRTHNEGVAPTRKSPKITQLLYVLFILLILAYVIYFFVSRSLFLETDGLIEVEKVDLGVTRGGKVAVMDWQAGDTFMQGDVLAVLDPERFCAPPEPDLAPQRLAFEIEEEKITLLGLRKELRVLRQYLAAIQPSAAVDVSRALEINAPITNNTDDAEVRRTQRDIQRTQNDINLQQNFIATLNNRLQLLRSDANPVPINPACNSQTIVAPFAGRVFSITHAKDEVADSGDVVLTVIPQQAEVAIEMYLNSSEYKEVRDNTSFSVTLPDGTQTPGLVAQVDSSAIAVPDRKLDGYRPLDPGVRIKLNPPDAETARRWESFDRYQVNVKGRK